MSRRVLRYELTCVLAENTRVFRQSELTKDKQKHNPPKCQNGTFKALSPELETRIKIII